MASDDNLPILYYVHDPMCSWCWGFRAVWLELQEKLKGRVTVKYVLGGLAPDSNLSMPVDLQGTIRNTWKTIQREIPGTQFNYDFWTLCQPRRSTYPACRAIVACKMQRPDLEMAMLLAIQQAYYLDAKNPSDDVILIQLARNVGLDTGKFISDFESDACHDALENEILLARKLYANSFPSLIFSMDGSVSNVRVDYTSSDNVFQHVIQKLND